jgi:glycosyltransferase involved in cell wall biosynthesis
MASPQYNVFLLSQAQGGVHTYTNNIKNAMSSAGCRIVDVPGIRAINNRKVIGKLLHEIAGGIPNGFDAVISANYGMAKIGKAIARTLNSKSGVFVHGFAEREAELKNHGSGETTMRRVAGVLESSDFVFFVSEELHDHYSGILRLPEHSYVLKPCVDREVFHPSDCGMRNSEYLWLHQNEKFVFLTVSNMDPGVKLVGLRKLLDAIEVSGVAPKLLLVVVGNGSELDALKVHVRQKELSESVKFLGYLSHEKLRHVYHSVDALIQIVDWCGFDLSLLEAMSCGLPALVTEKRDYRNSFIVGEDILVTQSEVTSISDSIRTVIEMDSAKLKSIGKKAASRIESDFSIQVRATDIAQICHNLL